MAERWLIEDFDTYELVQAVDDLDSIRGILADGPNLEPPQLGIDLKSTRLEKGIENSLIWQPILKTCDAADRKCCVGIRR